MSTTMQVQLSPGAPGIARVHDIPAGSIETANRLLQKNHDEHNMFWRDVAGHNHVVHSILTTFAIGGGPAELQRAFDDGAEIQQPIPRADWQVVKQIHEPEQFQARMGQLNQYSNFLTFFEKQIKIHGYEWVIEEFCFNRSNIAETMFARLFEGLYHPLIHLAFGIEFRQPTIIAEALAQIASHDSMGIEDYLIKSEKMATINASAKQSKRVIDLYHDAHACETLRRVAHGYSDGPARVREGVLGQAGSYMEALAAQFYVPASELDLRLAEITNCSAYLAGAAQRRGKARKVDFFHLHTATSSLSLAILLQQSWISTNIKARLLEFKTRVDLVWYVASGAVGLRMEAIEEYIPGPSAGMHWGALYDATTRVHDDGHLAKFIRALKLGQDISGPHEKDDRDGHFPVRGDMWLTIAQVAYDSTFDQEILRKWIWGVGFDDNWANVPSL